MRLRERLDSLLYPGSTRRAVFQTACLFVVAAALAYGTTFATVTRSYAEKVLGHDAPPKIRDGTKHGRLASGWAYSFPIYDGKVHLAHFPPCVNNDPGCVVDLEVSQETNAPQIFVFCITLGGLMFLLGIAAVFMSGRRAPGLLHGKRFFQLHTMTIAADGEHCQVQRQCDDLRTEGPSLLVPIQLDYVQDYQNSNLAAELVGLPSFRWDGDDVKMTHVKVAKNYYDGVIWFTSKKGPVTFHVSYAVLRNMHRDRKILQSRLGTTTDDRDEHRWLSAANWKSIELQYNWSKDFAVATPRAYVSAGHGAEEKEIPVGPKFTVIQNNHGHLWTLKLDDVPAGTQIRVAWSLQ